MTGYEALATLTSEFPELFIVRKFDRLSTKIVLAMQAELLYLERKLEICVEEDEKTSQLEGISASFRKREIAFEQGMAGSQKVIVEEVQEKLTVYHKTLLRMAKLRKLKPPTARNKSRLWDWLLSKDGGDNFFPNTLEASPWNIQHSSHNAKDLVGVSYEPDALDNWLSDNGVPFYHRVIGRFCEPNVEAGLGLGSLWNYSDKTIHLLGNCICVLFSWLVPAASIQALWWIQGTIWRLVFITVFILGFATATMFITDCRRFEVLGATAASAAVQVVFLQGLNGMVNHS